MWSLLLIVDRILLSNITITDVIPSGLASPSVSISTGSYTIKNGVITWTINSLNNGTNITLTLSGTAVAKSVNYNNATLASQTEYNPLIPYSTRLGVYVPAVDIKVTDLPWAYLGDYDNYYDVSNDPPMLLSAVNYGPDDATNVELEFDMGSSFEYLGVDTRGDGYVVYHPNNNTLTWYAGTIPANTGADILVFLKVIASGDVTPNQNTTCKLTHVDQYDTNPSSGVSSFAISTDPAVDIQVNQSYTQNGSYVTYTITAANNGPDDATNVQITDSLPSGLKYNSSTISRGTYNPSTGIWNLGSFNYGDAPNTLTITALITAKTGVIKNYAMCTAVDQYDWNWADDGQETILNISGTYTPKVDIQVTDLPWLYLGSYDNYYDVCNDPPMLLSAVNYGPDDATNVELEFDMGSSFEYLGVDTRGDGYVVYHPNNNTLTWYAGTIPANTGAELLVFLKVIASGDVTPNQNTTCKLTHVDQYDTNPSSGVSSFAISTDPAVDIQVNQSYTQNGSYVTYTITAANNGPDDATNVQITDSLPSGLKYVSSTTSQGTYNPSTGIWNLGSFNYGDAPNTLTITALITAKTGVIKNYAMCTAVDQYDWNWADDGQETILNI